MQEYEKFLDFLNQLREQKINPGLARIQSACKLFGHPERQFKSIHLAGTNGKGSTAVFLESIIRNNGYRVGLFTSPHLIDVRERIQIDRRMISKDEIVDLVPLEQRQWVKECELSYYELLTLLAFLYFAGEKVDFAVIETGLGGRWDATNVIQPLVTVMTSISIDHTAYLGSDIVSIAGEKCGIIKGSSSGRSPPTVTTRQLPEVLRTIQERCDEVGSKLISAWPPDDSLKPSLKGRWQIENASLAVKASEELCRQGYGIRFQESCLDVEWAGRLQTISEDPEIIVDGAHNPDACRRLSDYLEENYKGRDIVFIFSAMRDKDIRGMVDNLRRVASGWVIFPLEGGRAASAGDIKRVITDSIISTDIQDSVEMALGLGYKNPLIVVTGSLYLVGKFLQYGC